LGHELLLRQVHPSFCQEGRPSTAAFKPSKKDNKLLSVSHGALISAEGAFNLHTIDKGLASEGVWALTVKECTDAELAVYSDPVDEPGEVADPAHAVVDFRQLSLGGIEKKAAILAANARARAKLYP
jgi:hypothetical protein